MVCILYAAWCVRCGVSRVRCELLLTPIRKPSPFPLPFFLPSSSPQGLFSAMDRNNDNVINIEEFISSLSCCCRGNDDVKVRCALCAVCCALCTVRCALCAVRCALWCVTLIRK